MVARPRFADDLGGEPRSIDLREYWLAIRRRLATVVAVTVLCGAIGAVYAVHSKPSYKSTAQVVVAPLTEGPLDLPAVPSQLVNMSTEQTVASSPLVIANAARILHVSATALQAKVTTNLTVTVPTTSDVLQIVWQASSPAAAEAGADAFARGYLGYRHAQFASQIASLQFSLNAEALSLQKSIGTVVTQLSTVPLISPTHQSLEIKLSQLSGQLSKVNQLLINLPAFDQSGGSLIAASPGNATGFSRALIVIIAVFLGLLLGFIVAFIREVFDDRIRDSAQLASKLGSATLAVLQDPTGYRWAPVGGARRRASIIAAVASPAGRSADGVRTLRTTLGAAATRHEVRTILVVAADPSMSSSQIAAELGTSLAESGRRVLLVAADLRGSLLPDFFNVPNEVGLGDLLVDGGDGQAMIMHPKSVGQDVLPSSIANRIDLLPAGALRPQALSALDSKLMLGVLDAQRGSHDFILLDSPPAAISADVVALASHVDGVLVMARKGRSKGRTLEDLSRRLDQVGANILGGVFITKNGPGRHVRLPVTGRMLNADQRAGFVSQPPPAAPPAVPPAGPPAPANTDAEVTRVLRIQPPAPQNTSSTRGG
jgi:succinoglycan biosynthesis transport protein ExoP